MLVVVDLQRSFINENTEFIIDKIKKLVNSNEFDKVIFTKFVNNEDSIYVSKLNYKGCLTNEEQEIMIELAKRMRTEEPEKLLKEIKQRLNIDDGV